MRGRRAALLPLLLAVAAMCAFQCGAALAKSLFPVVGARGAAALRLTFAALILLVGFRAWRTRLPRAGWVRVARYGAALALMNLCFYLALQRLPLGIAVSLEFTGPLAVALSHSRRAVDFLWAALAIVGLVLLLPLRNAIGPSHLDPLGMLFALGAGLFWALYIVWGRQAGLLAGTRTVALGMFFGALVALPIGAAPALPALFSPTLLGIAVAVAVLSSALPYTLEMLALTRLPPGVFGVLMSLEPAIAALTGWLWLGEQLRFSQLSAIAAIMVASGGAALSIRDT